MGHFPLHCFCFVFFFGGRCFYCIVARLNAEVQKGMQCDGRDGHWSWALGLHGGQAGVAGARLEMREGVPHPIPKSWERGPESCGHCSREVLSLTQGSEILPGRAPREPSGCPGKWRYVV